MHSNFIENTRKMLKIGEQSQFIDQELWISESKRQEHGEYRHSTDFHYFFQPRKPDDFSPLSHLVVLTNNEITKFIGREKREKRETFFQATIPRDAWRFRIAWIFLNFVFHSVWARRGFFRGAAWTHPSLKHAGRLRTREAQSTTKVRHFLPNFFLFRPLPMWKLRYTPLNLIPLLFRSLFFFLFFFFFFYFSTSARNCASCSPRVFLLLLSPPFFSLVSRSIDTVSKNERRPFA